MVSVIVTNTKAVVCVIKILIYKYLNILYFWNMVSLKAILLTILASKATSSNNFCRLGFGWIFTTLISWKIYQLHIVVFWILTSEWMLHTQFANEIKNFSADLSFSIKTRKKEKNKKGYNTTNQHLGATPNHWLAFLNRFVNTVEIDKIYLLKIDELSFFGSKKYKND